MRWSKLLPLAAGSALLLAGCADPPPRRLPIQAAPSANLAGAAAVEVSVVPAHDPRGERLVSIAESTSTLSGTSLTLAELVNVAYRTPENPRDALPRLSLHRVVCVPALPSTLYDVRIRVPGADAARLREELRRVLRETFEIAAHTEVRDLPALAMVAPSGQIKAFAAGPARQPIQVRAGSGDATYWELSGDDLALLADQIEDWLAQPLVDETGLRSPYRLSIREPGAGDHPPKLDSLRAALRDQLGLELRATRRTVEYIIVERALLKPNP